MNNIKVSKLGGINAWTVWVIVNLIVVLGYNLQTGYAFLNHSMAEDLNLTITLVALAGSVYTWVFAVCQFFSGSILDSLGIRKVFPFAVLSLLIGAWLFAHATSLNMIILAQVFLAIGASFGFVGAGFTGGLWFGFEKFGVMFGLTQAFASFGSFIGANLFTQLIKEGYAWNQVLTYVFFFGVGVFTLVLLFVRDPVVEEERPHAKINGEFFLNILKSILTVAKSRYVYISAISGGIIFGTFLSIAVLWGPKLMVAHGFSEADAGIITSSVWIGIAIACFFVNKISDKLKSRRKTIFLFTLIQMFALLGIMYIPSNSFMLMLTLMFLTGVGAAGHMLAFTVGGETTSPNLIGTSAAVINGTMFIMGGIIIGLPSKFLNGITLADYQQALLIAPVLLLLASVLVFAMQESYAESR